MVNISYNVVVNTRTEHCFVGSLFRAFTTAQMRTNTNGIQCTLEFNQKQSELSFTIVSNVLCDS